MAVDPFDPEALLSGSHSVSLEHRQIIRALAESDRRSAMRYTALRCLIVGVALVLLAGTTALGAALTHSGAYDYWLASITGGLGIIQLIISIIIGRVPYPKKENDRV